MPKKPPSSRRSPRPRSPASVRYPEPPEGSFDPADAVVAEDAPGVLQPSPLAWQDDARGLFLYHGDCLEVMDAIARQAPRGVFDISRY